MNDTVQPDDDQRRVDGQHDDGTFEEKIRLPPMVDGFADFVVVHSDVEVGLQNHRRMGGIRGAAIAARIRSRTQF